MAGAIRKDFIREAAFELRLEKQEESGSLDRVGWDGVRLLRQEEQFLEFEFPQSRVLRTWCLDSWHQGTSCLFLLHQQH